MTAADWIAFQATDGGDATEKRIALNDNFRCTARNLSPSTLSASPYPIWAIDDFLTDAECDRMLTCAKSLSYHRSWTAGGVSFVRTSSTFDRTEETKRVFEPLALRAAAAMAIPRDHLEASEVIRYTVLFSIFLCAHVCPRGRRVKNSGHTMMANHSLPNPACRACGPCSCI